LDQFGPIEKLDWKTDSSGGFRGYCYVTYSNETDLIKALKELNGKVIDGRSLKCEISSKRTFDHAPSKTIFVKNLPSLVTEDQIRELFSEFGNVEDIRKINDKPTGQFKRCAFVDLDSIESATKLFESGPYTMEDEELVVDYATPKHSGGSGGGGRGGRGFRGGRGGGRGFRGGGGRGFRGGFDRKRG